MGSCLSLPSQAANMISLLLIHSIDIHAFSCWRPSHKHFKHSFSIKPLLSCKQGIRLKHFKLTMPKNTYLTYLSSFLTLMVSLTDFLIPIAISKVAMLKENTGILYQGWLSLFSNASYPSHSGAMHLPLSCTWLRSPNTRNTSPYQFFFSHTPNYNFLKVWCKWVFYIKKNPDVSTQKYKA